MAVKVSGKWTVPAGSEEATGVVMATDLEWGVDNELEVEVVFENLKSGHVLDPTMSGGRADFDTRIPGATRSRKGTHASRDPKTSTVVVNVALPGYTREWTGIISCPTVHAASGQGPGTVFAKGCELQVIAKSEPVPVVAAFPKDSIVLREPGRLDLSQIVELSDSLTTAHSFVSLRNYYEPATSDQGWVVVVEELTPKRHELDPYVLPEPHVDILGEGDGGNFYVLPVLPNRDYEIRLYPTRNGVRGSTFYGLRGTTKPLLGA